MFLLSPLFYPDVIGSPIATGLLAMGLAWCLPIAAAGKNWRLYRLEPTAGVILAGILVPLIYHLIALDVRNPWMHWREGVTLLSSFLLFHFFRPYARAFWNEPTTITIFLVAAHLSCAVAVAQSLGLAEPVSSLFPVFWNDEAVYRFFSGMFHQPNLQGLFLAIAIWLVWHRACTNPAWELLALIPAVTLAATGSRSAMLLLLVALAASLMQSASRSRIALRLGILGVALWTGTELRHFAMMLETSAQVTDTWQRFVSGGYSSRLAIWAAAGWLGLQHPLAGIGYGNMSAWFVDALQAVNGAFPSLSAASSGFEASCLWAHNLVLEAWMEAGLPGLIAIGCVTASILVRFWKESRTGVRSTQSLCATALVLWLISGMLTISSVQPYFLALAALFAAGAFDGRPFHSKGRLVKIVVMLMPIVFLTFLGALMMGQIALRHASKLPMTSNRYLQIVQTALNDPWNRASALILHYRRLAASNAPSDVWAKHLPLSLELFHIMQSSHTTKMVILSAHAAQESDLEQRFIAKYLAAFPKSKTASLLRSHIHPAHKPALNLEIGL